MKLPRLGNTYSILYHFILFFVTSAFLLRLLLVGIAGGKADLTPLAVVRIFGMGLIYDFGVALSFVLPYSLYLLLVPAKWNKSILNKIITFAAFFLSVFIIIFSFFAEYTFWNEFESRFNFIAVDYLVYTYEVVNNINESYPLPILISGILLVTGLIIWFFVRKKYFAETFHGNRNFVHRLTIFAGCLGIFILYLYLVNNNLSERSSNRYQNELAKSGIYSFFAAYRNNELNYDEFYKLTARERAFSTVRSALTDNNTRFTNEPISIKRNVISSSIAQEERPNVIMVTIESLSAGFLGHFGNDKQLTPTLDSLWDHSIRFNNMYATGTRTVRGMEALTLAVPPTPGSSIVRRPGNDNLITIGEIFREKGYSTGFFYGGDGYFDNMNQYFGRNGYSITDRGRRILATDQYTSPRYIIPDSLVNFENAWGICDEDIYDAVVRDADAKFQRGQRFYDFVMTTSNHRPYTYPAGKIDIPSGTGRDGAVKYTDFAIKQLLEKIKNKPWFKNTVLIFVADHCASSAGKNEIDISKYHIPALICNLDDRQFAIDQMCSQIDLYPTLFSLFNWSYTSNFYGKNVLSPAYHSEIFLGTYQKLAYLRNDSLVILSPQKKIETFEYNSATNQQIPQALGEDIVNSAISYYQTAYYLFKHDGLKQGAPAMAHRVTHR